MTISWGKTGDVATLLEAFHRVDLDEQAWLDGIRSAFAALTPGGVPLVGTFCWEPGRDGFRPLCMAGAEGVSARTAETSHQNDADFIAATIASDRRVYVLSDIFGTRLANLPTARLLSEFGMTDMLGLQTMIAGDPVWGVSLGVGHARRIDLSGEGLSTWHRISAHLAAAARLRREGLHRHPVESVLTPDGRVQHAEGTARDEEKREALTRAVRAIERARRREARTDPGEVLEAWRAIVERRWTLVDVVESDGRRFMLARVNPPAASDHAALTPREKQVAALLMQGVPQKVIGYELSMSPSTVAFHVKNAARKLGLSTSTELVRALATRGAGG